MGTFLMEMGPKDAVCPEIVNIDRSDILKEIAARYIRAGSDIILTNTFGASPLKLSQYGLEDKTEIINTNAVRAARSTADSKKLVFASIGPCGGILKPYGDIDPEEVSESFVRQVAAIEAEGVDAFCIETMTDLTEAILAIKAVKKISPDATICASMTFDPTPNGFFTIMGVGIPEAVKGLSDAGADLIGSNCGNGIDNMVKIAAAFRQQSSLPLIIQSNAGLPVRNGNTIKFPETPEYMAERIPQLIDSGVRIIGGCCGTNPDHITAFRKAIDKYNKDL
jgi:5-methyltetrahydrofolate--homocysteine methyltransferase